MSTGFDRQNGELRCDGLSLVDLARDFGTPLYVYSWPKIEEGYRRFDAAFASVPHLVCYAAKANSSLAILKRLAALGAGADVVSGGELRACLESGFPAERIVFSGVGKTDEELHAGVAAGILAFNAESEREIERIGEAARALGRTTRVALRVNPDIDARSHPYISTGLKRNKFGVDIARARAIFEKAKGIRGVAMTGVQAHIGSQILEAAPLVETARALSALAASFRAQASRSRRSTSAGYRHRCAGADSRDLRRGSASGDRWCSGPPSRRARPRHGRAGGCAADPGPRREREREKSFVIVDAAMNDLLRPALYEASTPSRACCRTEATASRRTSSGRSARRPTASFRTPS